MSCSSCHCKRQPRLNPSLPRNLHCKRIDKSRCLNVMQKSGLRKICSIRKKKHTPRRTWSSKLQCRNRGIVKCGKETRDDDEDDKEKKKKPECCSRTKSQADSKENPGVLKKSIPSVVKLVAQSKCQAHQARKVNPKPTPSSLLGNSVPSKAGLVTRLKK